MAAARVQARAPPEIQAVVLHPEQRRKKPVPELQETERAQAREMPRRDLLLVWARVRPSKLQALQVVPGPERKKLKTLKVEIQKAVRPRRAAQA